MEETPEQKEKRLRTTAALLQADCDHDWSYFLEHVSDLDREIEHIKCPIIRSACGLVVVQCYLNGINRTFQEIDDERGGSCQGCDG